MTSTTLIERLQAAANKVGASGAASLLREAAAALEAEREDAERCRGWRMKREDVERLLRYADTSENRGYLLAQISPRRLAALCRSWLAVAEAPVCEVSQKDYPAVIGYIGIEVNRDLLGQLVRIVPEQGEG